MIGSKKYKTKLTDRLHMAPRNGTPSISSNSEAASSATRVSLEPLNLRGQFFKQDDDGMQHIPIRTPDGQGEGKKGGYFSRITGKGYVAPAEQDYEEEPRFMTLAKPRVVDHQEGDIPLYGHMEDHDQSRGGFRNFPFGSGKPKFAALTTDSAAPRMEPSRTDPFPGITPMDSPMPTGSRYSVEEEDYFDTSNDIAHEWPVQHSAGYKPSYGGSNWNDSTSPVRHPAFFNQIQRQQSSEGSSSQSNSLKQQYSYGGSTNQSRSLKEQLANLAYVDPKYAKNARESYVSYNNGSPPAYDDAMSYEPKYQKGRRAPKKWYGVWSTRKTILCVVALIILIGLAVGLGVGLVESKASHEALTPAWRPAIGTTWQIQLASPVTAISRAAYIYDLDLFDNNATIIQTLHGSGKRVVCYFSVGTYQSWRPDASQFPQSVIGNTVPGFANESYIDIRNAEVVNIMMARLELAKQKGCDGIDPDNIDLYSLNSGFPLTQLDATTFLTQLGKKAHESDMAMGLKNAPELINSTFSGVDWHLVESCAARGDCERSHPFIQAGKPVFQIEYANNATASVLKKACNANGSHLFSTLIKKTELDLWAATCPFGDPQYEAW